MSTAARGGHRREVRIIGGQWKRSKLQVADVPGLRPTPDRVRETLFNWLGNDLDGWRCLAASPSVSGRRIRSIYLKLEVCRFRRCAYLELASNAPIQSP